MSPRERVRYFTFLGLRALVAIFDLIGILAIGLLATSIALFITLGSDSSRVIEFAGLEIPAVTAQTLPVVATSILFLFLGKALSAILLTRQLAHFLAKIEARAARRVAETAFGAGLREARKHTREEIYFAVQTGSPSAFNSLLNSVGTIVAEGLLFTLVIGSFFIVDPPAAIAAILYFGAVAFIIQYFIGNQMQIASTLAATEVVQANSAIGDLSEVLREATILNKSEVFLNRIHSARIRAASSNANQFVLAGMPRYIVEAALMVAVALFVLAQASRGDLINAAGTVGVFLSGGLRLTASLLPLQSALISIKQSTPLAEKALNLLEVADDTPTPSGETGSDDAIERLPVAVRLTGVSYSYPGSNKPALSDASLSIAPGQQAALIGHSGSGKSTIADLILGLIEPSAGKIQLDDLPPSAVLGKAQGGLAYVPQKPGMVSGSIKENIALGVAELSVDEDRLRKAIQDAHLQEIVESLPEGMHTDLGKRKDALSGGQLQRIGLARALYTQPRLLVLDEATSALDAESESEINKALDEMRGSVTVLLIAHRLNTIQKSDVVFLVDNGTVTASGTFPELLQNNPVVQKLADLMKIEGAD
jgi:ABC-type multidrug transport system fused ATPase/permease subunit